MSKYISPRFFISVFNLLTYAWAIFGNAFNGGLFGDDVPSYDLLITPASYAFSVWGYIFSSSLFMIVQEFLSNFFSNIPRVPIQTISLFYFGVSNIFNGLWPFIINASFTNRNWLVVAAVDLISIFGSLFASFYTNVFGDRSVFTWASAYIIGPYCAWTLLASKLNIFIALKYVRELSEGAANLVEISGIITIVLSAPLAIYSWLRLNTINGSISFNSIGFLAVQAWGLSAIIVKYLLPNNLQ